MSDTTMKVETKNANSGNNSYPGQIGRPPHVAGHGFRCWFDFANYHWSSRSCRMLIPARLSCSPFANITGGQLFLKLASIHLRRSKGSSSKKRMAGTWDGKHGIRKSIIFLGRSAPIPPPPKKGLRWYELQISAFSFSKEKEPIEIPKTQSIQFPWNVKSNILESSNPISTQIIIHPFIIQSIGVVSCFIQI